ncbi:TadE/TadG family type IV pilus assembly protein [Sphingobium nicotianae]|uniref:Pilus assembly protein n=1 Tax=Sphingobium nicotianae TaxID=2782607 RepID=A0A9X1DD74_9SPHN|nr:TadE/TadG family type IV pilus assembly protein [Sphingobium nicotianae]MBT2187730.1 pilus assembly protein [Sphingobium nicotianae]
MAPVIPLPAHRRHLRRLARCQEGTTILEFGLIAPVLCVLLLGALDTGHTLYMQGVLQGAVQKAARDGTLETAAGTGTTQRDALDAVVRAQLGTLQKTAAVTITRRFYRTFSKAAAAQAETFTDSAAGTFKDGKCNNGEAFIDANSNGVFDRDGGDSVDHAGARDNVVYTVKVSYPRMFPIDKLINGKGTTTLTATTVLANQPFGDQGVYGPAPASPLHCGGGHAGADSPTPGAPYD